MSTNVSSSITLILAVFIPTLWIAFFSIMAIAISYSDAGRIAGYSALHFKLGAWSFVLVGILILRFTLMRLKRVEMDEEYLYASNYFKTIRYTYESVEKVVPIELGLFTLIKVVLWKKGRWGRRIYFIPSKARLLSSIQQYPKSAKAFEGPSI